MILADHDIFRTQTEEALKRHLVRKREHLGQTPAEGDPVPPNERSDPHRRTAV